MFNNKVFDSSLAPIRFYKALVCCMLFMLLNACTNVNKSTDQTAIPPLTEESQSSASLPVFNVQYEKFVLDNGLEVIFHVDKSDPVVAVSLNAHVGSARESANKTGFAHLFEHLLFLESENLGFGGLDEMSARIGGSGADGFTNRDATIYYQTVPKDALEKMIWAEADKLGWFINTVTEPVLEKEKQVVINEKRQYVDNVPYGYLDYFVDKHLYPKDHPYSWQVIGSLEHLLSSKVEDVKQFYKKWYVPNNVTLVLAGDFDTVQAKKWIHRYFDEIPRGQEVKNAEKQPASLAENKLLVYEDSFISQPRLNLTWPTPHSMHPDTFALKYLIALLADGDSSPLHQVLVDELNLVSDIHADTIDYELAGQTELIFAVFENQSLDDVFAGVEKAFKNFEKQGITQREMQRVRAKLERVFYERNATVTGKSLRLAKYNLLHDNPSLINEYPDRIRQVTLQDVLRVYHQYIKNRPFIAASMVPVGGTHLALSGSKPVKVEEKSFESSQDIANFDFSGPRIFNRTPSKIERSQEPPFGPAANFNSPDVWSFKTANNIEVAGINDPELPLVSLELRIRGGQLFENMENLGISYLTANMLDAGTLSRTKQALEKDIAVIGADIEIDATATEIIIYASGLAEHYEKLMAIISEMILQPAFEPSEFEFLIHRTKEHIKARQASTEDIAHLEFKKLLWGTDNVLSQDVLGTMPTLQKISLEDLKGYHNKYLAPSNTVLNIVGSVDADTVKKSLASLTLNWNTKHVPVPSVVNSKPSPKPALYFFDVPGATQSQIRIGKLALKATDDDFFKAKIANYKLGSGGFASKLLQVLRNEKGYTYHIDGYFAGNQYSGWYEIQTAVETNVTSESIVEIFKILDSYSESFSPDDLADTKSFFIRSRMRYFESQSDKLRFLESLSELDFQPNFMEQQITTIRAMHGEDVVSVIDKYLDPKDMMILVVGDKQTQLEKLEKLPFGKPVLLN